MRHPSEVDLALHAGGDLPPWKRLLTSWHLRSCPGCRACAGAYGSETAFVEEAASELPPEVAWDYLASEMRANIQVGLQANECVSRPEPATDRLGWRVAAALASVSALVAGGWWLQLPRLESTVLEAGNAVLAATADGIELTEDNRVLTLMHESSEPVLLSVNLDGAMSAHFVDDETGMVTINNVYVE